MKTALRNALNTKVHGSLFILTCLLLGAVAVTASLMAWDVLSTTDKALQQSGVQYLVNPHI